MILVFEEDRIITSMAFIVIVSILEFLLCTVQALTCTFPMGVLERNCLLVSDYVRQPRCSPVNNAEYFTEQPLPDFHHQNFDASNTIHPYKKVSGHHLCQAYLPHPR